MYTRRRIFSPTVAKAALALGALSGFALTPQAAFADLPITVLGSFNTTNGSHPQSGVIFDGNGNLFGTTGGGGANSNGTVFEIVKGSTTITTIAAFNNTNGSGPGGITFDSSGNLFGTTGGGGANNFGTAFEIAKGSNIITSLASFNNTNGASPTSGVTLDSSGNLFGTTQLGGANGTQSGGLGYGTIFEIAKGSNTITTLASFNNTNGANPIGGVTLDSSGNLFGTTTVGGANSNGTVYEIAKGSNTIITLAAFDVTNGFDPESGVTLDSSGNLFGTTYSGGPKDFNGPYYGTVFEIAKGSNTITTLAAFNITNGTNPNGGVTFDGSGNLYGTTGSGGANNKGTVYEIAKGSNTITTLVSFNGTNGSAPSASITFDSSGNLYGTTSAGGGTNKLGTVFEIANASPAPEPSQAAILGLMMTGLTALLLRARRRTSIASEPPTGEGIGS